MLDRVTSSTFAPLVGEPFQLEAPGAEPFEIVLTSCDEGADPTMADADAGARAPFSLLFHATSGQLVPQQICTVRHPQTGDLELFVVPLGPDGHGMRYEVIFN